MGTKIGSLTQLAATPASGDKFAVVDISTGVTKYVTYTNLIGTTLLSNMFLGYIDRPKFEYKDTDEIYVNPGTYCHVDGTATASLIYWTSQLTFQFGPGGSNANSDALSASEWHYLYIDDSELSGSVLTVDMLYNTTSAPHYVTTKRAMHNTSVGSANDQCIGAFLTNASSQIVEFWHGGGIDLYLADMIEDRALADLDTTPEAVTLTVPDFSEETSAIVNVESYFVGATGSISYKKTGSSATTGHQIASGYRYNYGVYTSYGRSTSQFVLSTDSSQSIDVWSSSNSDTRLGLYTVGYRFPRGM